MKTEKDVVEMLRRECQRDTQQLWAEVYGFSPQFICDVLKGRREVSEKLAAVFGLKRQIVFIETR